MYKVWLISIIVLLALGAGAVQFFYPHTALAPVVSSPSLTDIGTSSPEQGSTPKETAASSPAHPTAVVYALPLAKGDSIASWNFNGAYAGDPALKAKAEAEIARLSSLVGTEADTAVSLYVGIANQYDLLGEGKQEYEYLNRAVEADATSGLPWHNLGVLMERLGALQTARIAYEKSTLVQPQLKEWHRSYLEFLTTRMKGEIVAIEKEYTAAQKNLGDDPDITALYSAWTQS